MYGVIDIGSNTMRLSVYDYSDGKVLPLFHKKEMAGLASYISKDKVLSQKGIDKGIEVLSEFKTLVDRLHLEHVYAFATASLRNIENTKEAVEKMNSATGFEISVISGNQEAIYAYMGAASSVEMEKGLVIDIGGGSTEMVFFSSKKIQKAISLPIGSLNMYTHFVQHVIPTKQEKKIIKQVVTTYLDQINTEAVNFNDYRICGVGGTVRAAGKLNNRMNEIENDNTVIAYKDLKKILKKFFISEEGTFKDILQVVPDRIHTIVPGLIILSTIAEYYSCSEIEISNFGVREGYIYNKLHNEEF